MKLILFLLLPIFAANMSFAKDGVVILDTKKTHLSLGASNEPRLEFRTLKTNKVKIELNRKGLFVDSKLVCGWPGGEYSQKDSANMVLGFSTPASEFVKPNAKVDYTPCPKDVPVKSTWGDGGTGAAALFVEVEKVDGESATVEFRGERLMLDLRKLKYRVEPPGSLSNEPGD